MYKGKKVICIIPAGGYGKRLAPITDIYHKSLIPLFNEPILYHIIYHLNSFNVIDKYIMSVSYLSKQIKGYLSILKDKLNINIELFEEKTPLGNAAIVKEITYSDDTIYLVYSSDVISNIDLNSLLDRYCSKYNKYFCIVSTDIKNHDENKYGIIENNRRNRIVKFLEKSKVDKDIIRINTGIYIFDNNLKNLLKNKMLEYPIDWSYSIFPNIGKYLYTYLHKGYWIDIGTVNNYLKVYKDIFNNELDLKSDGISIQNKNKNIKDSFIDKISIVGNDVDIQNSIIMKNVTIKDNVSLYNCIILDNTTVEKGIFQNVIIHNSNIINFQ